MKYFLGVDGGQSSTTALIGDENRRVIGKGRGGPCNHVAAEEGRARFLSAIGGSISAAREQAGIGDATFESACFGLSGGPEQQQKLLNELVTAKRMTVTHDALVALAGACAGEPGVIAIAGTGSIAFGRNAARKTARVGGWGYVFGDEGGAFDIARQALRAALRYEEGWGPDTSLLDRILQFTGAKNANEAMHLFYTPEYPRSRIAQFAVEVDAAANQGDRMARHIMESAARQLAAFATATRNQLFEAGEQARVSYIGGVFRSAALLDKFRQILESDEGTSVGPPIYGPAAGALIEAYQSAGIKPELTGVPESEK